MDPERFYPFYVAYANPMLYSQEKIQEKEFEKMKSYYPEMAGKIQEQVEIEVDRIDYDGSMLYDEYPDKYMMYHICRRIRENVEMKEKDVKSQAVSGEHSDRFLDELIQVMLYQEVSRRRCRRKRCRYY